MNVIDTTGMSREQWLALRRQSIGASDAPVIAGLSKYKSRFQLWLEKTGQVEPEEAGEEAWWGTKLEHPIHERLRESGVFRGGCDQVMLRASGWEWMTCTLDWLDGGTEAWEFKAAGIAIAKGLEDGNPSTLPDSWILQAHHQMTCADTDHVNFAVFVGHRLRLYQFRVDFSEDIQCGLLQLEHEFWQHIQDRTPPTEFDPQDAEVLLKHYRRVDEDIIVTEDVKIRVLAADYERTKAKAAFQAALADQCKAALLAHMATASAMRVGPYLMRRSKVDVKAIEAKPRAAYSYTKFTFTNTESDE